MKWYKYQGAGNDFLIADNRQNTIKLTTQDVARLCDRHYGVGADGLMLLEDGGPAYDFRMVYYNSDGSTGMMCGNGGRCIVAFAAFCGIKSYHFIAADGPHDAEILMAAGILDVVRLKMRDVTGITRYTDPQGAFLDTGTRHFVMPVVDLANTDVEGKGRYIRLLPQFAPDGVNVNFIEPRGETVQVRTFEKGVEAETYACGTGITAAAIAHWHFTHPQPTETADSVLTSVKALRDTLMVDFTPTPNGATNVYLIGPATRVAEIIMAR